jgi:DNA-binding beta-propeller fold protein YncE
MGRGLVGAFSVAVAPDGRNVYVASFQGVAAFLRYPATGALKQLSGSAACVALRGMDGCAPGRALDAAASVTVSPDGHNVYVASSGSNAVAVFSRDPTTGEISQLSGLAGCTSEGATEGCQQGNALRGAFSVTVSPDGRFAYVGALYSSSIVSFERDPADGELHQIPGAGECTTEGGFENCATGRGMNGVNHVAVSPDGGYVYAAASGSSSVAALFRTRSTGGIDQLKGRDACTSEGGREGCAPGRGLGGAVALAISPDGRSVYVAGLNSVAALARNRSSGVLAQLSGTYGCATETRPLDGCAAARGLEGASSVAISPDGRFVYVASLNSAAVSVFARVPRRPSLRVKLVGVPGACVSGRFTLSAVAASTLPLRSLSLRLDGRSSASARQSRLTAVVDASRLPPGSHTLAAAATDLLATRRSVTAHFLRC